MYVRECSLLVMVGRAPARNQPVAMFRNPRGRGYMARRGDFLGRSYARIKVIRPERVVVDFPYRTGVGQQTERIIALEQTGPRENSEDTWRYSR